MSAPQGSFTWSRDRKGAFLNSAPLRVAAPAFGKKHNTTMPSTKQKSKSAKRLPIEPITFETGSGNVFADMGLPNAEVLLAKATLVAKIQLVLEARKLSTAKAAALLKLEPQRLERLLEGQTQRFTIDRLFRFLNLLGLDVEIAIRPSTNGHSPILVK